jgi:uncharacterized membrane protein
VTFAEIMEHIARTFEAVGALVLVAGLIWSVLYAGMVWRRTGLGRRGYETLRESYGGVLLLGLEILVAADLVQTVAVEPTLENVAVLGLIVVIRTVLSFSLEIEIEGVAPWRRAAMSGASHISRSVRRGRGDVDPAPAGDADS